MRVKIKFLVAASVAVVMLGSVSAMAAPGNDDILNATAILSLPFTATQNTGGARLESEEPQPCGNVGSTVWYRYTATDYEQLVANTLGSDFDTVLAVYGGSPFSLYNLGCSNDAVGRQSIVEFYTGAGETYFIQAGGASGRQGNLTFTLSRPGTLEGSVTDATDGDELADICVDVFNPSHVLLATTTTDRFGDYVVPGLPEGAVKVRFTDCLEGTYGREWYSDETSFGTAELVPIVADETTSAVDAALGLRPGPNLVVTDVAVENVPLVIADTEVPIPTSYNRTVVVSTDNIGPIAGRKVIVHAEACPRSIGSCKQLGDRRIGRVEPGEASTVSFDWNALDTIGDVTIFVSVFGTRDMDTDDNVEATAASVWVGGTGFGITICKALEGTPCL